MKWHVIWGHASAHQIKQVLADSEGGTLHLLHHVDELLEHCEVCRAFDRPHRVPVTGASTVSTFDGKLQVDLLFLGDIIALHVMDVVPKYSTLALERSENPQEVRMSPRARGFVFLDCRSGFKRMKGVNGTMRFGQIIVRSVGLSSSLRERARAPGLLNVGMVLHEEFMTA